MSSNKTDDTQRFSYKDIFALIIAAYQIILPKAIIMLISLVIVGLGLKLFLN